MNTPKLQFIPRVVCCFRTLLGSPDPKITGNSCNDSGKGADFRVQNKCLGVNKFGLT